MLLLQFVLSFLYSFHHRDYHTTLSLICHLYKEKRDSLESLVFK